MRRYSGHGIRRALGFTNPTIDRFAFGDSGYFAIRGREQQLIDFYGGIGSPRVANLIRAVWAYNRVGRFYHDASNITFGPLAPYTGR